MYKLIRNSSCVLRLADLATIPADPRNADHQAFIRWRDGWTETLEDGTEIVHPPHAPEPADPLPAPTAAELELAAVRVDAKVAAIAVRTPADLRTWVNNNFPTLTPAERDRLATLAVIVGQLARRI